MSTSLLRVSSCTEAYSNQNVHSPEVTSKAITPDEEHDDSVKTLREKLATALQNISAKDDLVKQHSKVAEEAVSGWEKAENEVFSLKQQLESLTRKSSSFEDRAIHLDVALKECMRQLRQEREEQEQKIQEAINKNKIEWDSTKSELQEQLVHLQSQLKSAKSEAVTFLHVDLRSKLRAAENEISSLKQELFSRAEELELRTIERDLSTEAAESASRQNLENVKKVAKLETECRRLKAMARKVSSSNDQRSVTESSVYVESLTDSQSDIGERLSFVESNTRKVSELEPNPSDSSSLLELTNSKNVKAIGKNCETPSLDISIMDDFLEMERFVALPDTHNESLHESRPITAHTNGEDITIISELAIMRNRNTELEEKLVKMEADKNELEESLTKYQDHIRTLRECLEEAEMKLMKMETDKNALETSLTEHKDQLVTVVNHLEAAEKKLMGMEKDKHKLETSLTKHQDQLKKVQDRLERAEMKFVEMEREKHELETSLAKHQDQLGTVRGRLKEEETKLVELQDQLFTANEARQAVEAELHGTNLKKEVAESRLKDVDNELKTMSARISSLEEEVQKERSVSEETISNCRKLEQEISRLQHKSELQRASSPHRRNLKQNQDKELAVAAYKFSECQKTIASLGRQLKSLATLEDFLIESDESSMITGATTAT
uniref:Filament-like plant protein n=1 Tax=Daucus carota subsp. sativus TaxID=79200 RepID=A0A175YJH1_DAUCS